MLLFRYIRGEPEKTSCVERDVGNVAKDSEITFEYGVHRHHKKQCKMPGMYVTDVSQL